MTATLGLTGCDTREDWFQKEGEGATLILVNGDRVDTIDWHGYREVEYTLHVVGVDKYDLYSDTMNLQIYGMTNKSQVPAKIQRFYSMKPSQWEDFGGDNIPIYKNKNTDGSYSLYYLSGYKDLPLFVSPTEDKEQPKLIGTSDLWIQINDIFENEYTGHILIKYMSDCPPTPVLTVKDVAGKPMEKTLSMAGSYDEDGTVSKYEYCIDGNIAPYKGYSNRLEIVTGDWQSGKAAYGGTYITATELSEIKHAFQEKGEHVIYYRCMDNVGAWSMWKSETITIN